ncbi:helix-turn-helix domain-containing protein [Streptomyces sp. NPDC015125]|uniref:helix-turn-helix domain-containing protein n=1 Tax=Streptomyces sp. NPDC015125 TaxID=3364938 RepID=UPI00370025AF
MILDPAVENLRHGYTLDDLDRLARTVLVIDRWRTDINTADRYAAIHFAITEQILTADEPPTGGDLIACGLQAANRYVRTEMHHHGYNQRDTAAGPGALPGFQRYWQQSGRTPWDERLMESLTLAQIWPCLTLAQQQAVMALALTGDHQEAADSLGLTLTAFSGRLKTARRRVFALWYEHETPPRRRRLDKRVLARSGAWQGRRLLTESDLERLRSRRNNGATLQALSDETGYSKAGLSNLLNGKRKPAPDRQEEA